jgi:nucleotide-binding universal stress UspA family protein
MADTPTIVCALDFSEGSEAALVRAADLAERLHARLHLLHAHPLFLTEYGSALQPEEPETVSQDRLRAFAEEAVGGRDAVDVLGPELVIRHGEHATETILGYAEEVDADLLVLGTHGRRGVRHLIVGSVAEEVVRRAPCPVLTVPNAARRTAPGPTAPVLVPVDFSAPSRRALARAKAFAASFGAPVALVHVLADAAPYPPFYLESGVVPVTEVGALTEQAETHLRRFDESVGGEPATDLYVRVGAAHLEVTALAEEVDCGLIVMATHGLTGLRHALIGSVTERTLRHASCPVLSIRIPETANGNGEAGDAS